MLNPRFLGLLVLATLSSATAFGGDWPAWRHDAGRTGATADSLPETLHLQWTRKLPQAKRAWPESQTKLDFDASYQPVVAGGRMFVGSNVNDSLTCYDVTNGQELWRFHAEGPIRFAPVVHNERVYAVSDDAHLYCVNAEDGALVWNVSGAPAERRILGNDRLVSSWPLRGGVVVADGVAYFTAGIWPTMGIFIHAVDTSTGEILWTNSRIGSEYTVHPHGAPAFGSVVPQGYLAVTDEHLIVPGGRSLPALVDRKTGKVAHFDFGGKASGGYDVAADGNFFFVRGEMFRISDGTRVEQMPAGVVADGFAIGAADGGIAAKSLAGTIDQKKQTDRKGKETTVTTFTPRHQWSCKVAEGSPTNVHLKAGGRIYAAKEGKIAAYDVDTLKSATEAQSPAWSAEIEGTVWSMLAANDRLIAVTQEGTIACFGAEQTEPVKHETSQGTVAENTDWAPRVTEMLASVDVSSGYAIVLGVGSGGLVSELIRQSPAHVIVVESDAKKAEDFRQKMDAQGLYGSRVAVCVGAFESLGLPQYMAGLITAEPDALPTSAADLEMVRALFESLRPYGGAMLLPVAEDEQQAFAQSVADASLANAEVNRLGDYGVLRRVGALPGAGDWTHQYGDSSNSVVSKDQIVKAPLGVLWFGGPPNDKILPRHGHGPTPQVAGGRLFIEGPDILRAVDVYTGRLLWEKDLPDLGKYYNRTDHFAGANEIGSNYVSLADAVYVVYEGKILELSSADGKTTREFTLPAAEGEQPGFGFAAVADDLLIATSSPVKLTESAPGAATVPEGFTPLVERGASWQYLAGSDPEGDWAAADYDELKDWKEGPAGFGYGDSDDGTVLVGMRGNYSRVYIRKTFDGAALANAKRLGLQIDYDDGFIAYLNGREILRKNVTERSGRKATGIEAHEAGAPEFYEIGDFHGLLNSGTNVIAIEGHNLDPKNSDFSLSPALLISAQDASLADADAPKAGVDDALEQADYAASSRRLVVYDRTSGQPLWSRDATYNFRHNTIAAGNGRIYCVDGMSEQKLEKLRRRGIKPPENSRLLALDARTGDLLWSVDQDVFGTFLNYSAEHDVVLQAGSKYRDRAEDEVGKGMVAYRGASGEVLWKDLAIEYGGPCLLWKDKVITNGTEGFQLELLTGKKTGWTYSRMYGCNTVIGSQNLLTFRSGAAGFCDLAGDSGTGNIGGFRSSCTSNLIAADGVLNAPDYTRTCVCAYQNQTSLALVHMPNADAWTFNDKRVEFNQLARLGINFGAPGDRRSEDGTLWLEWPSVGGPGPTIEVKTTPEKPTWYVEHASAVSGDALPWVTASGGEGISSVTIPLSDRMKQAPSVRVRLYFAEPNANTKTSERVFDVNVEGRTVLDDFDMTAEAGGPRKSLMHEIPDLHAEESLDITLTPSEGSQRAPILCGVEIVADDASDGVAQK